MSADNEQLETIEQPGLPLPLPGEDWRAVPDVPTLQASNLGRIRRTADGAIIKATEGQQYEYPRISFWRNGKMVTREVHRLVASAFYGAIPAGLCVNHRDGNKENNAVENLEVVTRKQNFQHALQNGFHTKNKLQAHDVGVIRTLLKSGVEHGVVANAFGVKPAHIALIEQRKVWASLPEKMGVTA